jgi:hypothetical protein
MRNAPPLSACFARAGLLSVGEQKAKNKRNVRALNSRLAELFLTPTEEERDIQLLADVVTYFQILEAIARCSCDEGWK